MSRQRIAPIKGLFDKPAAFRRALSVWPVFAFAGIRVQEVADDFSRVRVRLAKTPFTSNYVGTQFGGSLFSMTDPFFMIMMLRQLGRGYVVWDQAGEIVFKAPGTTAITAELHMPRDEVERVRALADAGETVRPWYSVDLLGTDGTVVATVRKQLYIRRA